MVGISLMACFLTLLSSPQVVNKANLIGRWKVIEAKEHAKGIFGEDVKTTVDAGIYFEFSKDKITLRTKDKVIVTGEYKTNQRNIDLIAPPDDRTKGIFKIEKMRLTLCFPVQNGGPRPRVFELKEMDNANYIWVLERENSK